MALKNEERLYNLESKQSLIEKIASSSTQRITVSFYRYQKLLNPQDLRDNLYKSWSQWQVLGRIYLAHEGINAQLSVPQANWDVFWADVQAHFPDTPAKIAVSEDSWSFCKLIIKVRKKLVADGLDDESFDVTNTGPHLSAVDFNAAMEQEGTIVVDMRNHYESEIGHFKGAICPDVDTFREELPVVHKLLEDKKNQKILLYCTGGIRCEKASAYLKHHGFKDVNQLSGGIIDYARQVKDQGLDNKFIGKNFVFDERLGERISDDIIAQCHQCGSPADTHVNCGNDSCHVLFIQCDSCRNEYQGCCSHECLDIKGLPPEERQKLKEANQLPALTFKKRLRPHLREYLQARGIHS